MNERAVDMLECPICREALSLRGRSVACPAGHSFDIAREGYVNLLTPQQAMRKITGDTAEMIVARREFLDAGLFSPLTDLLADMAVSMAGMMSPEDRLQVLEAGCGEGHYVGAIVDALDAHSVSVTAAGFDVSKAAVRLASRRHTDISFFTSDINDHICVRDSAIDLLIDVFAPRNTDEFARILSPAGRVAIVIPGQKHLAELRDRLGLLDIEPEKETRIAKRFSVDFRLIDRHVVEFPVVLTPHQTELAVSMGPNKWHAKPSTVEASVQTEASFIMLVLKRQ